MLLATTDLLAARNQMALTLGAHIVLACFGVAFPAMIFVAHRRGLRGDDTALVLAKRWSKVAAVLFAVGAVSGTILSFEMGLLWPAFMERYGDVIGLPFALEGISFFVEAIFIGIYLYGWGRLPGRIHSLMLIPVITAGVAGTFFILSVNSWMNAPAGFDIVAGEVTNVDPLAAMLNDAVWLQYLHMLLAAYMVVAFLVASVYALGWLRGRRDDLHRLGLTIPLAFALVATPLQPVVGHFLGQQVADNQPIKLAAMEGLYETEAGAPLTLGGLYIDDELRYEIPIPIPGLASFIAQNDGNAVLPGLASVPEADRPPVNIVRISFQLMVAIGMALVGLVAWFGLAWQRGRRLPASPWFMRSVVVAGPAAVLAMELGWVTTEVGRQPWIAHELMRTEDAVTDTPWLWLSFGIVAAVYVAMGIGAVVVLRSMSRRWAAGQTDLETPYGPPPVADESLPPAAVGERV